MNINWLTLFEDEIDFEAEDEESRLIFKISEFEPKTNNKMIFQLK